LLGGNKKKEDKVVLGLKKFVKHCSRPSNSRHMPVEVLFSLMLLSLTGFISINMFITNCPK